MSFHVLSFLRNQGHIQNSWSFLKNKDFITTLLFFIYFPLTTIEQPSCTMSWWILISLSYLVSPFLVGDSKGKEIMDNCCKWWPGAIEQQTATLQRSWPDLRTLKRYKFEIAASFGYSHGVFACLPLILHWMSWQRGNS